MAEVRATWQEAEVTFENPENAALETWSAQGVVACPEHSTSVQRAYDPHRKTWASTFECDECGTAYSVLQPASWTPPTLLRSKDGLDTSKALFRAQRISSRIVKAVPRAVLILLLLLVLIAVSVKWHDHPSLALSMGGLTAGIFGTLIIARGFFLDPVRARRLARSYWGRNPEATRFFEGLWGDTAAGFALLVVGFLLQAVALLLPPGDPIP